MWSKKYIISASVCFVVVVEFCFLVHVLANEVHNSEDGKGSDDAVCKADEVGDELRTRAENAFRAYEKLHARIMNPRDHSVQKQFLVLQVICAYQCMA